MKKYKILFIIMMMNLLTSCIGFVKLSRVETSFNRETKSILENRELALNIYDYTKDIVKTIHLGEKPSREYEKDGSEYLVYNRKYMSPYTNIFLILKLPFKSKDDSYKIEYIFKNNHLVDINYQYAEKKSFLPLLFTFNKKQKYVPFFESSRNCQSNYYEFLPYKSKSHSLNNLTFKLPNDAKYETMKNTKNCYSSRFLGVENMNIYYMDYTRVESSFTEVIQINSITYNYIFNRDIILKNVELQSRLADADRGETLIFTSQIKEYDGIKMNIIHKQQYDYKANNKKKQISRYGQLYCYFFPRQSPIYVYAL